MKYPSISRHWQALVAAIGLALMSSAASAGTISGCASCNGGVYTLTYSEIVDGDLTTDHLTLTYSIDTSGVTGVVATAVAIDAVAFKITSNTNSLSGLTLTSAPGTPASWSLIPGGIDAGGCSGSGGGFECEKWVAAGVGASIGGTLTWVFDLFVDAGDLFTGINEASIKARYVDASGDKIGALVSENITLTTDGSPPPTGLPEPGSLALVGLALAGAGLLRRRKA